MYYAHKRESGELQTLQAHLTQTAKAAAEFASAFQSGSYGKTIGVVHDAGKASKGFEKRLLFNGPKVDHSTLGAQLLAQANMPALAFTVAGHHTGLPDYGAVTDFDEGVLARRLKKQLEYDPAAIGGLPNDLGTPPLQVIPKSITFTLSVWIRMLFSCLVDADYLDTEAFMSNGAVQRGQFASPDSMLAKLTEYLLRFREPTTAVHVIRNRILDACLEAAGRVPPGLYSLTVPTGGGKTIASLAFALKLAAANQLRRVIYCLPYTSILEQNAGVVADIVGSRDVLTHYADAYQNAIAEREDEEYKKRLATENWDHNLIFSTNVQFFESIFGNKPSKCRKLHRIAQSVIILDEAQMLPRDYLKPCVRMIEELCLNYGCTIVLMSATQPALAGLLSPSTPLTELNPDVQGTFAALKRTTIKHSGDVALEDIASQMNDSLQSICILNTKKKTKALYNLLQEEGCFHLSTRMLIQDRQKALEEIRERLRQGLPCRVAATSLVEAGVDLDFPLGFREETGLDSIIQAAGRVNREGKNLAQESYLYVFRLATGYVAPEIRQLSSVTQYIFTAFADVSSPEAIAAYFYRLYNVRADYLDKKEVLEKLRDGRGLSIPFATIAQDFRIIEEDQVSILIPANPEACGLIASLQAGETSRELLRKVGRHSVNVWREEFERLEMAHAVQAIGEEGRIAYLIDGQYYNCQVGLDVENAKGGQALFDS